jgi:hypothetical protein
MNQNKFKFDGSDYIPDRDDVRLSGQILRVWECMKDEKWRTLREISNATGDPEASISAQLRHLRKPKFGSYDVEKEYISNGLFKYKLLTQGKEKLL